jgi:hypothetical protein
VIPGPRFEDALLRGLWEQRSRSGWWLLEVPLGYPGTGAASRANRRIDAIVLPEARAGVSPYLGDLEAFEGSLGYGDVELIEAKRELNVDVIGQLLCGASMFTSRYPQHGRLRLIALVAGARDAALRWFCHVERIEVITIDPSWLPAGDEGGLRPPVAP